jgi:hypothetical protein
MSTLTNSIPMMSTRFLARPRNDYGGKTIAQRPIVARPVFFRPGKPANMLELGIGNYFRSVESSGAALNDAL